MKVAQLLAVIGTVQFEIFCRAAVYGCVPSHQDVIVDCSTAWNSSQALVTMDCSTAWNSSQALVTLIVEDACG